MKQVSFLFIFLFQICSLSFSQTSPVNFEHLTTQQGLSSNSVFSICQDKFGFLWVGAENGLNRYDGYNFKFFTYNPNDTNSISNNKIWDIVKDKNGTMWFATEEGLCSYDYNMEQFIRYYHNPEDSNSLGYNMLRSLYVDSLNNLWIGTYGGGLDLFNQKTREFTHFKYNPHDPISISDSTVLDIYEDSYLNLWIATDRGLDLLNRKTGKFTYYHHDEKNEKSLSHDHVICMKEDRHGNLWLGTWGGGLNRLNCGYQNNLENNQLEFKHYLEKTIIQDIIEDKAGNLWVATRGGGIYIYDSVKDNYIQHNYNIDLPKSLNNDIIVDLFEDAAGVIWVGTLGGGINKYDRKKFDLYHSNSDFKNINSLFIEPKIDGDIVWIGSQTEGLIRWDRKFNKFKYYLKTPVNQGNEFIRVIHKDKSNRLWIGTDNGLCLYENKTESIHFFSSDQTNSREIYALFVDSYNYLWIGTFKGGLNRLNLNNPKNLSPQTAVFENSVINSGLRSLNDKTIRTIYEDCNSILWVGTERGGLNRFDQENNRFISFISDAKDTNSLSDNYVRCIFEDSKFNLWIGTSNGLNKLPKGRKNNPIFIRYTEKNGLSNNSIRGIQEDLKGNLWVSTDDGISKLDTITNEFKRYATKDGLQGEVFNDNVCAKGYSGILYFGGNNGLNIFYPDSIITNGINPTIIITKFKIGNQSVPIGKMKNGNEILSKSINVTDRIKLKYKERNFSFEFSALNYSSPENNNYKYILEGFDKTWSEPTQNRTATYTNIDPGEYTFKVKASSSDGVWGEVRSLHIIISTPFWRTWWGIGLFILLCLFILYLAYKKRVHNIEKHRKDLSNEIEKRTAELEYLNEAGQELTGNIQLNEDDILRLVYKHANKLVGIENIYIALYDPTTDLIQFRLAVVEGKQQNIGEGKWKSRNTKNTLRGKTEEVILEKKPILISSLEEHIKWYQRPGFKTFQPIAKSWLGVPMKLRNGILGVVAVYDFKQEYKYNYQDSRFLSTLATQASIALDNAHLFHESENRIKLLEIAAEVGKEMSAQLSKKEMFTTMINRVKEQLRCNHCSIFLPDKNKEVLKQYQITDGIQIVNSREKVSFKVGEGLVGWAYKKGEAILRDNVYEDERFIATKKPNGLYRSMLVVPIKSGNFPVAMICADQDEYGFFTKSDQYFLEVLARIAVQAIDIANGLASVQKIGEQILNVEVSEKRGILLLKIVQHAIKLTNATTGVIYLISEDRQTVIDSYYPPGFDHPKPRLDEKVGITWQIIETRQPIIIIDIENNPLSKPFLRDNFKSMIGVPLLFEERVVGVLYLIDKIKHEFSEVEKSLLKMLAGQATIAILNAKLYQKQDEDKKTIERNLIMAKMFSHRIPSRIGRSIQFCDDIKDIALTSDMSDLLNKKADYLKRSFISTNILTEFLLGSGTISEESFEKFDFIELLHEIREDVEFEEINRWKEKAKHLEKWKCEIEISSDLESYEISGNRVFIRHAIDNFVANAVEALRKIKLDGRVKVQVFLEGENLVSRIISNGPPIRPLFHFNFINKIIYHKGDLDSLIDIKLPIESEDSTGMHRRLGLKTSTFIIKNIHKGQIILESGENESPSFLILLPLEENQEYV